MSSSNQRLNKAAIDKYRKELKAMLGDISEIDSRILAKATKKGLADVKRNTPVVTGFMRRSWAVTPTKKAASGAEKSLINTADYSSYVNYGHRIVNRNGETVGWVPGRFMLEKAVSKVERQLAVEFKKEVERVNREHDK